MTLTGGVSPCNNCKTVFCNEVLPWRRTAFIVLSWQAQQPKTEHRGPCEEPKQSKKMYAMNTEYPRSHLITDIICHLKLKDR